MKLPIDPRLPLSDEVPALKQRLAELFREIATQVNQVSEGALQGTYNAQTAAPTHGNYRAGDFIRNSQPSEIGAAGGMYVVTGWLCVAAGSPGAWVESRALTGN